MAVRAEAHAVAHFTLLNEAGMNGGAVADGAVLDDGVRTNLTAFADGNIAFQLSTRMDHGIHTYLRSWRNQNTIQAGEADTLFHQTISHHITGKLVQFQ